MRQRSILSVFTQRKMAAILLLQPASELEAASIWVSRIAVTGPLLIFAAWRLLRFSFPLRYRE